MPNRFEIPEINVDEQLAKGLDSDLHNFFAFCSLSVAIQRTENPDDPENGLVQELNRIIRKNYPNGPTEDLLGKDNWYDSNVKSHLYFREKLFRNIGGLTTLELIEKADKTPFSVDYIREATGMNDGAMKTRTAWDMDSSDDFDKYIEKFNLDKPEDNEIPQRNKDIICFYEHGEYFFPTFQFHHEGEEIAAYIDATARMLNIKGKYPSFLGVVYWTNKVAGTDLMMREYVEPTNFKPNKLWNIYKSYSGLIN